VSLAKLQDGGSIRREPEKAMEKRLPTVMDVFVLTFCNILELLVSRVSGNDKVYELEHGHGQRINQVRQKGNEYKDRTDLSCRGLSTFVHPPIGEHRVLGVRQIEGDKVK
jgi:hypothetical protein